jgi:hypothetical protein
MGRIGMGPIDLWAQIGRAQTGWAESPSIICDIYIYIILKYHIYYTCYISYHTIITLCALPHHRSRQLL